MNLAAAFDLLASYVQTIARGQESQARRLREVEETMATRAELSAALTQMETALRATVDVIGTSVTALAARVSEEIDLTAELERVNAATQTLTHLADTVQQTSAGLGSP